MESWRYYNTYVVNNTCTTKTLITEANSLLIRLLWSTIKPLTYVKSDKYVPYDYNYVNLLIFHQIIRF